MFLATIGAKSIYMLADALFSCVWWQVWFRVNDLLPDELQNSLPARPPEVQQPGTDVLEAEDIIFSYFSFYATEGVKSSS